MEPDSKRRKCSDEAQEVGEPVSTVQLNLSLPSGRAAALSLPLGGTVLDLKMDAQQSDGLQVSGFRSGDNIAAVAQQLKGEEDQGGNSVMVQDQLKHVQHIVATRYAFAALLADGSVVTSGDAAFGGDSTSVRDEFKYS